MLEPSCWEIRFKNGMNKLTENFPLAWENSRHFFTTESTENTEVEKEKELNADQIR